MFDWATLTVGVVEFDDAATAVAPCAARSAVMALPPDTTRAPLVAAIIAMAGAMGLRVVGEGIEAPHQAKLLESLGCDEGKGYLLGRPLPPHQVDLSRRITADGQASLTA